MPGDMPGDMSGDMSGNGGGDLWRLEISVADHAAAFETVLDPYCDAISWYVTDDVNNWQVEGFSGKEPDLKALGVALELAAAAHGVAVPELHVSRIPVRDWVVESLRKLPPTIAGRYFIHGSHHPGGVPAGKVGLLIDAGAAFGSGQHESTSGCLLALDGLARRRIRAPLDMGCGSGILTLAMARTWRVPVTAVDNDPKAVGVTRENARRNGLAALVRPLVGNGYASAEVSRRRPFDLVVSNILADPLCRMARNLSAHLADDGIAVLSGFLARDGARVFAAHRHMGLRLVRRIAVKDWQTLVLSR